MAKNFRLVLLEDVVPGMVLSDNLLDRHGKVLLPEGTTLNEKLIDSLQRYEMEMLPVYEEPLTEAQRAARVADRMARLEVLFRLHDYGEPQGNANEQLLRCLAQLRKGGGHDRFD